MTPLPTFLTLADHARIAVYAAPAPITARLDDARWELRLWQREVNRLEALARTRAEQISRGEWPPKAGT